MNQTFIILGTLLALAAFIWLKLKQIAKLSAQVSIQDLNKTIRSIEDERARAKGEIDALEKRLNDLHSLRSSDRDESTSG
jgi:peptidoglycan hydrolase CwlO-like protein